MTDECEICGKLILLPNGGTVCDDCVSRYKERGPTSKGYWLIGCEIYSVFLQSDGAWACLIGSSSLENSVARFATEEAARRQLETIWDDPNPLTVVRWECNGELAPARKLERFKAFVEPRIKNEARVIHEADMYNANRDEWEQIHDKEFIEGEREAYLRDTGFYPGSDQQKRGHRPPDWEV